MGLFDFFTSTPPAQEKPQQPDRNKEKEKQWKDPNEKEKYVNEAGLVMCPFCNPPIGGFVVTSNTISLQDRNYVTEEDKNGKVNLDFKGVCMHPSQKQPPCKAVISTTKWKKTADTYVNNFKALLAQSTITCMISGQDIKIIWSGQKAVFNDVKPPIKEEKVCQYDDVILVADYIEDEMLKNRFSEIVKKTAKYNDDFVNGKPEDLVKRVKNKYEAYKLWAGLVGKGCDWDYKSKIQNDYEDWSCNKKGKTSLKFYFDIWANVHYGYVGKCAGFTEFELLNGDGVAQLKDNNKSLDSWDTWEDYLKNIIGDLDEGDILGGFEDPADQQAIKVGFALYDSFSNMTVDRLITKLIMKYYSGKPIHIVKCEQH